MLALGGWLVFGGFGSARASVRAAGASQDWLQGWPMAGHDPQRTSRSPVVGPVHPHFVFSRKHFYLRLIGPDGRLYGNVVKGRSVDSVALSANGKTAVDYRTSRSPLALLPSGVVVAATPDEGQLHGYYTSGKLLWAVQHVGLFKGAAPLATTDDRLFAPFVGHPEDMTAGLDVVSESGQVLQRIDPGVSTWSVALASTGTIYLIAAKNVQVFIEAVSSTGCVCGGDLWEPYRHSLQALAFALRWEVVERSM